MKSILAIWSLIGILFIGGLMYLGSDSSLAEDQTCPSGSYQVDVGKNGEPVCKIEPTGCPYGDSIPIDSPKCTPPPEIKTPEKPKSGGVKAPEHHYDNSAPIYGGK